MAVNFPKEEERILAQWNEINAFHRQLELSAQKKPYTFYDGPLPPSPPSFTDSLLTPLQARPSLPEPLTMATFSPRPSRTSSLVTGP